MLTTSETLSPEESADLSVAVREGFEADSAIYPTGGETALDFGLTPKKPGVRLSLTKLNRVIDYPARDMTITVEAGITMRALAELLATERQRLPVDVPHADRATLGGVVATNWNGPRRLGQGTVRDYVIGITAVDGRGIAFKGGGRVVKNVAGYDFCKLLTGSLGTLGVITQLTMKLKPIPERLAMLVAGVRDLVSAERLLAALVHSKTTPVAIELLVGKEWAAEKAFADLRAGNSGLPIYLAIAVEGTDPEVRWMAEQLGRELPEADASIVGPLTLFDTDASHLMQQFIEFPAKGSAPLVLKASLVPSGVTALFAAALRVDPTCAIQSHAGSGTVIVRFAQAPLGGMTKGLIGELQSAAVAAHGSVVVLSSTAGTESTPQSVWGTPSSPLSILSAVKRAFDPKDILNPGRFAFAGESRPAKTNS